MSLSSSGFRRNQSVSSLLNGPTSLSLHLLSRRRRLLFHYVISLDESAVCLTPSSVTIGPPSPSRRLLSRSVPLCSLSISDMFRSQFLDETYLPPALPEGVLPFYGSSPRRLSSVSVYILHVKYILRFVFF